ncbi:MAG: AbrB/MazE/SpoVT family DNA-binding domain-containing protein [Clostridia bacterium]|nr:AbrB/MazE/SpoVT family DNA-binding domain-containing protein [Clostridia bacterium]
MKSTGIVRKVDQLGRVVLPKELRKTLNIKEVEDSLEIYVEDNRIVLKKYDENEGISGIVRRVDQLGRIVLPIELRRNMNIAEEKDSLEIFVDQNKIVLKKYEPACIFCGNAKNVFVFKGKNICPECVEELKG